MVLEYPAAQSSMCIVRLARRVRSNLPQKRSFLVVPEVRMVLRYINDVTCRHGTRVSLLCEVKGAGYGVQYGLYADIKPIHWT